MSKTTVFLPTVSNIQIKYILVTSLLLLFSSPLFGYIAVINEKRIPNKEFQNYINVKKYLGRQDTFDQLVEYERKSKLDLLNEYVDHRIMMIEAKKKGISAKSKEVKEEFKNTEKQWVQELFSSLQKSPDEVKMDEPFVREFYQTLPQSKQRKYEELLPQEKKQLFQIATLKKKKESDDLVKGRLEKKHKVKRNGHDKQVSATVAGKKITKKSIDDILINQLQQINLSPEVLKEKDPKNYEKARNEVMERLIFEKLIELEIAKNGFKKKPQVKQALQLYMEKIVLNVFVSKVLSKTIKVTEQEMDQAFRLLSRSNPRIQQMLPSEQEKFLKDAIIRQKLPQIMSDYLIQKKEEIIIKKNRKELENIS